jgi:hypothetical protein
MTKLKSLFGTPKSEQTRKYRKENDDRENRVLKPDSVSSPGLALAYRRSIDLRKEYLNDSQKTLKDLLESS